jgi:hypothetical protein
VIGINRESVEFEVESKHTNCIPIVIGINRESVEFEVESISQHIFYTIR